MRSNGFLGSLFCWISGFWLLTLFGCSTAPNLATKAEIQASTPEQQVGKRAQARWDALLARDLKAAYGFISPAGRLTLPLEMYSGRVDPSIWKKAVFKSAECSKDVCKVQVTLDYTIGTIPLSHVLNEQWIMSEGEWWFVYTPLTG
jgi:hypothetical protein